MALALACCPLSFALPPKKIHELLAEVYKENKNKRSKNCLNLKCWKIQHFIYYILVTT